MSKYKIIFHSILFLLFFAVLNKSALATTHPQILFGPNDINELRIKAASTQGTIIWNSMMSWINRHFNDPYPVDPVDRYSARLISKSAMAYLITNDTKYAQKTRDWINYYVNSISDWQGGYGNGGTSYLVHDISLGYDWIQNWWIQQPDGETEILSLKNKMLAVVPTIDLPISQGGCGIRHRSYTSIGIAGYAFQGEIFEADDWIVKSKNWLSRYMNPYLGYGTDGFWADGPDYASGEQSELIGVIFNASKFHNDYFWDTAWSKNQKYYWSYMWTGADKTYDFFPTGDTYSYATIIKEVSNDYTAGMNNIGYYQGGAGPTMLLFSYLYQDPILQYFSQDQIAKDVGRYYWDPSVLWAVNPGLTPQLPVNNWPLSHYFSDFEAVVAKSDWTANATQIYLKAGVVNGKVGFQNNLRTDSYEAHAQEDANGMMIYSRGEYLIAKDAYTTPRYNNTISTILVDGSGQWHDGEMWGVNPQGHTNVEKMGLRSVIDTDKIFYTIGDAAYGFLPTKLNKFDRNVAFFRPDIFVVFDEVGHTNPHRYDWNLQLEYDKSIQILGNNKFREIGSRTADMNLTFIKPSLGELSYEQGTHVVTRCTNVSSTSPCELAPVYNAPYISFYPTTNVAQTQFLSVLETKSKGAADSVVTQIPATNGVGVQVGTNNYCLSADLNSTQTNLDAVKTNGRFLCWQGDQTGGNVFTAGPASQIEINPYKISVDIGTISIGLNQQIGQFILNSNTTVTLEYPGLSGIKVDGTNVVPVSTGANSFSFNGLSGSHTIELIINSASPTPNPADIDGNEIVNAADLLLVLKNWLGMGSCNTFICDLNNDSKINALDAALVIKNWGF